MAANEWYNRTMLVKIYVSYLQDASSVHRSTDADVFKSVQSIIEGIPLVKRADGSMYVNKIRTMLSSVDNFDLSGAEPEVGDQIVEITDTPS